MLLRLFQAALVAKMTLAMWIIALTMASGRVLQHLYLKRTLQFQSTMAERQHMLAIETLAETNFRTVRGKLFFFPFKI